MATQDFATHALYSWQASVLEMVRTADHLETKIHLIVSHHMSTGKTSFIKWLESQELALALPLPFTASEHKAYCVEMPIPCQEQEEICRVIRAIQERGPSHPAVFVFTNCPDEFFATFGDRSQVSVWTITADLTLELE